MIRYYIENYNTGYTVTENNYTKYFSTFNKADNYLDDNFYHLKDYDNFYLVCESFINGICKKIPIEY